MVTGRARKASVHQRFQSHAAGTLEKKCLLGAQQERQGFSGLRDRGEPDGLCGGIARLHCAFKQCARSGTDTREQTPGAIPGGFTDRSVLRVRGIAQLQHIANADDFARRRIHPREGLKRGAHGEGIGVIGIVDYMNRANLNGFPTHGRRLEGSQPRQCLFGSRPGFAGESIGDKCVRGIVFPAEVGLQKHGGLVAVIDAHDTLGKRLTNIVRRGISKRRRHHATTASRTQDGLAGHAERQHREPFWAPGWLMPASMTAKRASSGTARTESGSPTSLL